MPLHDGPDRSPNVGDDILEQAADWLTLMSSDDVTEDDRKRLALWCAESDAHQAAWDRAESLLSVFRKASEPVARGTLEYVEKADRRRALKTLALAFIAAPMGWVVYRTLPAGYFQADLRTAKGEQKTHVLDDGTQLTLNTASAVKLELAGTYTRVKLLAGEIRLVTSKRGRNVNSSSKNPASSVLVHTAQGTLRPLGTRFTVRQFEGLSLLAVFDGRVDINVNGTHQTAIVNAGEQRAFSAHKIQPARSAIENTSLWEQGMLLAQNMTLGELIAELSRYRHGILRCDPSVAGKRVSGAFPVNDTDASLEMLKSSMPVNISYLSPWWVTVKAK